MMTVTPGCGIAFFIIFLIKGTLQNEIIPEWACWTMIVIELGLIGFCILKMLYNTIFKKA